MLDARAQERRYDMPVGQSTYVSQPNMGAL